MARSYPLTPGVTVNGGLLAQEIQAAHGIDISPCYEFVPPSTLYVEGFDGVDLSATIAAHAPPAPDPVYYISRADFLARFTDAEAVAIKGSTDPQVVKAYNTLMIHEGPVNLKATKTVQMVNYLESVGLLAAGRAAEILTP